MAPRFMLPTSSTVTRQKETEQQVQSIRAEEEKRRSITSTAFTPRSRAREDQCRPRQRGRAPSAASSDVDRDYAPSASLSARARAVAAWTPPASQAREHATPARATRPPRPSPSSSPRPSPRPSPRSSTRDPTPARTLPGGRSGLHEPSTRTSPGLRRAECFPHRAWPTTVVHALPPEDSVFDLPTTDDDEDRANVQVKMYSDSADPSSATTSPSCRANEIVLDSLPQGSSEVVCAHGEHLEDTVNAEDKSIARISSSVLESISGSRPARTANTPVHGSGEPARPANPPENERAIPASADPMPLGELVRPANLPVNERTTPAPVDPMPLGPERYARPEKEILSKSADILSSVSSSDVGEP